jgi:UrcA family protein
MNKITAYALAACAMLAVASPAAAAAADDRVNDRVNILVSFADLNLSTADGAAALQQRVNRAVNRICGTAYLRDMTRISAIDRCRAAVNSSVQDDFDLALAQKRKAIAVSVLQRSAQP